MYLIKTLILLISTSCSFAREEDVVDLDDSEFIEAISDYETALVMFYAPWCGHCKQLKPEYAKAAGKLVKHHPSVTLAKVDCTTAKDICAQYSINEYPSLKIFRKGQLYREYNGPRDAAGIVKYMRSQVEPISKELKTIEELNTFLDNSELVILGMFKKETDLSGVFKEVAEEWRGRTTFGHSSSEEVLQHQGLENDVLLFRPKFLRNKFEPNSVKYEGRANSEDLKQWIQENTHGLAGIRTRDNVLEFKDPLVIAYFTIDYVKDPKGTNYWRNRVLKVAKKFENDFHFAVCSKEDFKQDLTVFNVDYVKGGKPVVFARTVNREKFKMEDEFSVATFEKFLTNLKEGKLEPFLKSEPIPETTNGSVTVAVAKNFDEVVTNNGRDTLLEFYAPWCGHCQNLAPVYEELAEKMKDEDVAIVKMDATANDVPKDYELNGFPTLYWLPKDRKNSPVPYDGGRELEDFVQYIAEHATDELVGYDRNGAVKKTEL